jgi:protein O-mannosyl-transferase
MKTICLSICCCFTAALLFSQTEKGLTPASKKNPITGTTRAVVIGISDYQDVGIPDLHFADKDAEALANFLRSPAGGSLDQDHLQFLTNKNATAGKVAAALDWLLEQSKTGDQVIIYFSGHGDVERKTISQPGFLLCWDSPAKIYMGGGTFGLTYFQEIVTTLSVQNKAKVVVITDACHAGKLAGSQIGGAQITGVNLARQYANEVKILSCQPDEFSLEGQQWGGGRGVFSYHLVEGLFGMADQNADLTVTVGEIDRYLEENVTTEAAPQSQSPILLGNKAERLAKVDMAVLSDLKKKKAAGQPFFATTESRGLEDDVLSKLDSGIVKKYFAFKLALEENRFFEPADNCAEVLYASLSTEPGLAPLHGFIKRNYAAALQDGAQQELNTMLKTGLTEEVLSGKRAPGSYRDYPVWLGRAASLLGDKHYMYYILQARKSFFEGKIQEKAKDGRQYFYTALQWQPDMPHAFVELISTCSNTEVDSAEFFARKAMELVPNWVVPHVRLSFFYQRKLGDLQKAGELLEEAGKVDSNSVMVWYQKANFYKRTMDFGKAVQWYKKAIEGAGHEICFNCALQDLGDSYIILGRYKEAEDVLLKAIQSDSTFGGTLNRLGKVYWLTGRYEESEAAFKKEIRLSPNEADRTMAYNELGNLNSAMNRMPEAEEYYLKSLESDPTNPNPYMNLAGIYAQTDRLEKAVEYCKKCIQMDSTIGGAYVSLGYVLASTAPIEAVFNGKKGAQLEPTLENYYTLACILAIVKKTDEALEALEKSIQLGFSDYDWLAKDADLVPLQTYPKWKELMKKYFPDKVKD